MGQRNLRMKILAGTVTTVVCLIGALWAAQEKAPSARVAWQHDLKAAQKLSVARGKPMLVVFMGAEGTWCKMLERDTFSDSATAAYINSAFIPVLLDGEKDRKIADILEVTQVPTSLVLSHNADLWGTISGYVEKARYRKALQQALTNGAALRMTASAR